jgi:N-succinyldiaminopimelate aminotransferase
MIVPTASQDILRRAIQSPFPRLRKLLDGINPGDTPIDLTIGEPRHTPPEFYLRVLNEAASGFGKYPPITGTPELRQAIAAWHGRRHGLGAAIDPELHILPLNGSREGLVNALFPAVDRRPKLSRPAVLIPNPFYQAYLAGALAAGCEPVMVPATAATGHLPDLEALRQRPDLLARTVAFYLCSPANPQGAVASPGYLAQAIALARQHDFMLLADECYSEIYSTTPPHGALAVAHAASGDFANVLALNSLSKRSSLPGLRSGFAAGDADFIARFAQFRNVAAPQVPLPVQAASTALWADETHVEASRELYRAKFDAAAEILGNRVGDVRPAGGFFLWLDTHSSDRLAPDGAAAAVTLWQRCGVKVLPGAYLAYEDDEGRNPGQFHVRIALVADLATTRLALERIVRVIA